MKVAGFAYQGTRSSDLLWVGRTTMRWKQGARIAGSSAVREAAHRHHGRGCSVTMALHPRHGPPAVGRTRALRSQGPTTRNLAVGDAHRAAAAAEPRQRRPAASRKRAKRRGTASVPAGLRGSRQSGADGRPPGPTPPPSSPRRGPTPATATAAGGGALRAAAAHLRAWTRTPPRSARAVARRELGAISHSMALEDQAVDDPEEDDRLRRFIETELDPREVWAVRS